jgi:hypothetical protein
MDMGSLLKFKVVYLITLRYKKSYDPVILWNEENFIFKELQISVDGCLEVFNTFVKWMGGCWNLI